jgi:hypothetical protein
MEGYQEHHGCDGVVYNRTRPGGNLSRDGQCGDGTPTRQSLIACSDLT